MAEEIEVKEKVAQFKELFRKVYHDRRHDLLTDYYRMSAELTVAGYRIEHSWGHYLTTPDGEVIVLDEWAEKDE